MNQDIKKVYKLIEALNMCCGAPKSSIVKKKESPGKDEQIEPFLYARSKQCNGNCIDCFLIFCLK